MNSHVLPEFMYRYLYDEKGRMLGIHGQGKLNKEHVQKGLREKLLCFDCEQFLNNNYEKRFKRYWVDTEPLPHTILSHKKVTLKFDYQVFKLFLLSVIWRCSISTLGTYKFVQLGPHEECIREMIFSQNPGAYFRYPIAAEVLVDKNQKIMNRLISMPQKGRLDGHTIYEMMFGGCIWYYKISNHQSALFENEALKENGVLVVNPVLYTEKQVVQDIGKVLRGEVAAP